MQTTIETRNALHIEVPELKKAALTFRAINHSLRQEMLRLIDKNLRITVTEIYIKLRLEQSVASQHLAILRRAGIVSTERDGKCIFYSINYNRLKQVHEIAKELN